MDVTKVVENGKVAQNLWMKSILPLNKTQSHTKPCHHLRQVVFVSDQQPSLHVDLVKKKVAKVAELIIKTLKMQKMKLFLEEVRSAVKELTDAFPLYED